MELGLSSLRTVIPSMLWSCNLDRLSVLFLSWLKYSVDNNYNHVLELGLALWMSSNGVVSFRHKWLGTWIIIITACENAKYQKISSYLLFCDVFSRHLDCSTPCAFFYYIQRLASGGSYDDVVTVQEDPV